MKHSLNPSLPTTQPSAPLFMSWLQGLIRQFPYMTYSALGMLGAFWIALLLMLIDDRMVLGISTWIKPAKFFLSGGIFLLTMSWVFSTIQSWNPLRSRRLSRIMTWLLNVEIGLILMQAIRGVPSHFNISSAFDAMIFSAMGILIGLSSLLVIYVGWIAWTKPHSLAPAMKWALRLGLLLFILSSFEGFFMAQYGQHTMGAADGGEGLPFLNWARNGGDLRIAHFLGMHGLQLFPLLAFVWRKKPQANRMLVSVAILYSLLSLGAFAWAMAGRPLF